jgi:riboflavin kinase/FMN adenylyltransferase
MNVLRGIAALPLDTRGSVATVGFFDGVHRGHRAVLSRAVEIARRRGVPSAAVTFDRHPREVLTPDRVPRLLTTVERKAALIGEVGIDTLVVLEFTPELSRWAPDRFLARVLRDGVRAERVVVGENFTFGHRAAGTLRTLMEPGPAHGFAAEAVALLELDGRRVSSSSIRESLAAGELAWPERALGRRFTVDGDVVAGAGRGAGLGYPTANLRTSARLLLPGSGIYAGVATHDAGRNVAAISVGTNPTFGSEPLHVEAYLLDYDGGDLRGRPIAIEFWTRLRDERRFDSPAALTAAIAEDVDRTRELVSLDTTPSAGVA